MQILSLGYFVIEFPIKYRQVPGYAYSKRAWKLASGKVVDVLAGAYGRLPGGQRKRQGGHYERGILRWHWFGDPDPVTGKATWNPHMNVLVDGGYLSPDHLASIQGELRKALKCEKLIVHYSYFTSPGQKYQKAEYVTRATFLDERWDEKMADELWNFRNLRYWGKWKDAPVWSCAETDKSSDLIALAQGNCPTCGKPICWQSTAWPIAYLDLEGVLQEPDGGYYRLKPFPTGGG
jgi:hypothetical protein